MSMADVTLERLASLGQSVWIDAISREMLRSGELDRMVQSGVRGLTSNPTIFERAVGQSGEYDQEIAEMALAGAGSEEIYYALTAADVAAAADILLPVWEQTYGTDGFVSLEVLPTLSHDLAGTVSEVHRLRQMVQRPNLMIKIPGTAQGAEALRRLTAEGININVTLLFSALDYERIARAYVDGLTELDRRGGDLRQVASVASVFVSRIDSKVDRLLDALIARTTDPVQQARLKELRGTAAVANAKLCYERFQAIFGSTEFKALQRKGARVQRLLWASTGTKDPAYSDVKYVQELIGPDTVNTVPPATLKAVIDHLTVEPAVGAGVEAGRLRLAGLKQAGIDIEAVCAELQQEGIAAFAADFHKLLATIDSKRRGTLLQRGWQTALATSGEKAQNNLQHWQAQNLGERLWRKDPTIWKSDAAAREAIANRLGWLDLPRSMAAHVDELTAFAGDVRAAGFRDVVLLGMGGSSLCSEVLHEVMGTGPDGLGFTMLDSTDPGALRAVQARVDLTHTLFIVASKSGTTLEPLSFYAYFRKQLENAGAADPGAHFIAITDPETPLVAQAGREGFRHVFLNPPDIGGRYSALSLFGLVPAALIGQDLAELLAWGRAMADLSGSGVPLEHNPAAQLGFALAAAAAQGRDKVTLVTDPALAAFGLWLEQLLAESTGKEGRGLVPIAGEQPGPPEVYGPDRFFVHITLGGLGHHAARVEALRAAGHPVVQIDLPQRAALGAEFLRWEIATAVAGACLGINPFDEPNVQEAKDRARAVLAELVKRRQMPVGEPRATEGGIALYYGDATARAMRHQSDGVSACLAACFASAVPGDYIGLLAYTPPEATSERRISEARDALRQRLHTATMFGFGPRYLHSTGQLHKGGPATGLFILLTADHPADDLKIPGAAYSFAQLELAQALGDMAALDARGRRAVRLHLPDASPGTVAAACRLIEEALNLVMV